MFRTPHHIDFGIVRHGSGDVLPGSYDLPTVPWNVQSWKLVHLVPVPVLIGRVEDCGALESIKLSGFVPFRKPPVGKPVPVGKLPPVFVRVGYRGDECPLEDPGCPVG